VLPPGNRWLHHEHSPTVVKNARSFAEKIDRKLAMMEHIHHYDIACGRSRKWKLLRVGNAIEPGRKLNVRCYRAAQLLLEVAEPPPISMVRPLRQAAAIRSYKSL
jgi:hypothetical protein